MSEDREDMIERLLSQATGNDHIFARAAAQIRLDGDVIEQQRADYEVLGERYIALESESDVRRALMLSQEETLCHLRKGLHEAQSIIKQIEVDTCDPDAIRCAREAVILQAAYSPLIDVREIIRAVQPATAEKPTETAYEYGKFNGVMETLKNLRSVLADYEIRPRPIARGTKRD